MSPAPGWYPDPGGQPDLLRFWDGNAWTPATRPATLPAAPSPQPAPVVPDFGRPTRTAGKSPLGWILAGIGVLVAVAVVIVLMVVTGTRPDRPGPPPANPSPARPVCPEAVQPSATPSAQAGSRVVSGRLSYPRLPAPFAAPVWDRRVPFGRDVQTQQATVEVDAAGRPTWVSGITIARLLAGDGFFGPQQGAQVVASCITGLFYGESAVQREDSRNEATTVDGRPAWIIVAHLSFRLPDISTTGETMTVLVVDVGDGEAGLCYTSNPDTSPQFVAPLLAAQAGLRVS